MVGTGMLDWNGTGMLELELECWMLSGSPWKQMHSTDFDLYSFKHLFTDHSRVRPARRVVGPTRSNPQEPKKSQSIRPAKMQKTIKKDQNLWPDQIRVPGPQPRQLPSGPPVSWSVLSPPTRPRGLVFNPWRTLLYTNIRKKSEIVWKRIKEGQREEDEFIKSPPQTQPCWVGKVNLFLRRYYIFLKNIFIFYFHVIVVWFEFY